MRSTLSTDKRDGSALPRQPNSGRIWLVPNPIWGMWAKIRSSAGCPVKRGSGVQSSPAPFLGRKNVGTRCNHYRLHSSGSMLLLCHIHFQKMHAALVAAFFCSLSVASLAGGTVHGFCPDEASLRCIILWKITLIATGTMAFAAWHVGAAFLQDKRAARWIKIGAAGQLCLFITVVLFYSQQFLLAALNYLPAAIFLLITFIRGYFKTNESALLFGATSIVLTFVGSFIQIARIPLHPLYFNHNALYHAVQFIALCLLFATAWWDITKKGQDETEKYYSA